MASHATQAGKATARDQASRPNLTVVSSADGPKDPDPGMTKGDAARAAMVAELPEYQQAEYARLVADGTRHVTALAAARKVPDPATATDDAAAAAAALFAAFSAAPAGAAAPPVTVPAAAGKPVPAEPKPEPAAPKPAAPKPAAAAPKPPKPPKPAAARPAAPADGTCNRYIGTVTAVTLDEQEQVFDCEHASRNGHQTVESAETCAKRLLRNHPSGTPGTRLHPVRRDLNGKRLS